MNHHMYLWLSSVIEALIIRSTGGIMNRMVSKKKKRQIQRIGDNQVNRL